MSENKKPRLAEVLGVEVGQEFRVGLSQRIFYINSIGELVDHNGFILDFDLSNMINNPQLIHCIRRWTEQDKEDARKIKAIFPDDYSLDVGRLDDGRLKLIIIQGLSFVLINDELLPSLKPGESATLYEIIGGTNE